MSVMCIEATPFEDSGTCHPRVAFLSQNRPARKGVGSMWGLEPVMSSRQEFDIAGGLGDAEHAVAGGDLGVRVAGDAARWPWRSLGATSGDAHHHSITRMWTGLTR